ncbi:CDP-alcohol phosphatidyltransferase family protein [bacterium]|nr:CDP-alcohol phosphatidyltransferase family protein [bacterium]MBU1983957.1 CDP-alcohol phosphatidyltransferase family protein [bacterium]
MRIRTPINIPPSSGECTDRFWTAANCISLGRLLLLVPLFVFLRMGERGNGNLWALAVMGIALISDMLDGMVARWLKRESVWGRVLDPIADKVWIAGLALFLALPWREHPLPVGFLALVLARDVAIVVLAAYAYGRTGVVMKSNWAGKIAMTFTAFTLIVYTIYCHWIPVPLIWLRPVNVMWFTVILLVLSGIVYSYRFQRLLAAHAENKK